LAGNRRERDVQRRQAVTTPAPNTQIQDKQRASLSRELERERELRVERVRAESASTEKRSTAKKGNSEPTRKPLKVIRRRKEQEPFVFETAVSGIPDVMLPSAVAVTDE
jgi:hypothetical protein